MKQTHSAKAFDCVEMKRKGAVRIYEAVKNMTPAEENSYWQRIDEDFQRRHEEARARRTTTHSEEQRGM